MPVLVYNPYMPRIARIVIPTVPHHITQRGNNQQDVFFIDDDRRVYLQLLKKHSNKFGLDVHGYCLMANHLHIVATPHKEDSLAKAMGRANLLYTQYINHMHSRSGHLWQNRFYSCPLDKAHFWKALRYIECNPVRAKLVHFAWDYPWSSAAAHTGKIDETNLLNNDWWLNVSNHIDWKHVLSQRLNKDEISSIRRGTHLGRPMATDSFISKLEHYLGRRLRPLPAGRPKRKDGTKTIPNKKGR